MYVHNQHKLNSMNLIDGTTSFQRKVILLISDSVITALTMAASFLVFYQPEAGIQILRTHLWLFILFVIVRVISFKIHGLYTFMWRYASTREFIAIFRAATLSTLAIIVALFLFAAFPYSKGIFLLDWLLNIFCIGSTRVLLKIYREYKLSISCNEGFVPNKTQTNILIIGAGEAAVICAREILRVTRLNYNLVGFVDDLPEKIGRVILQAKVLGKINEIMSIVEENDIHEAIIAIPSASGEKIREIIELCEHSKIKFKITPSLTDIIGGKFTLSQIRDVRIEDLLRRDEIKLEANGISNFLNEKVVLVTGAGGSIGSELCRQIVRFSPSKLILVDISENFMYHIEHELISDHNYPLAITPIVLDVKNRERLERVFETYKPEVVFHAAAHKHVPLMEQNVQEVIENNIVGTRNVLELSDAYSAKEVVLISTDKAVRTTNCMGATKRLCEILLQMQAKNSKTKFAAVRFGNVLGSHGSVVPLFKKQIANGGPITVTHEEMTRFFMTIPEAVSLVLQAGSVSNGGEIFILDMGKPIKIIDLARDMISLSGLEEGVDIKIKLTGLRPGEKLHEELFFDESDLKKTSHKKIFITSPKPFNSLEVSERVAGLLSDAKCKSNSELKKTLLDMALHIQPETINV
jgi:FlaA1/EpsC-like NDP-sugar epimerase